MIQRTLVGVWFLLTSLLPVNLCSAPPLYTSYKINMGGRPREQMINAENVYESGRQLDQDKESEVQHGVPLSKLHYLKWKDRDGEDSSDLFKNVPFLSGLYLQLSTMSGSGKKVEVKENANNTSATFALTTNSSTSAATIKTTNTTTAAMPYPVVSTPLYPSPSSSTSSCSSPACMWLASWHFIVVMCMTVTWLVALMILYCMTRTDRGRDHLEKWSSLCTRDKKDQEENQVMAKGIGYFDGSPGLRRFVLIEDEEIEEEEGDEDLFASEFKEVKNKEDETERERKEENRISKKWKPPRKGTYILQETSKKDVLEVGTYRLQEEEEEEEEVEKEEVQYILEGATYILQSERIEREEIEGGERFGQIGGIEGLYGMTGRRGQRRGGYGKIDGLEGVYGIMGKEGVVEQGRYRGVGGIDGLYPILQEERTGGYRKVVGVGGKRGEKDGVLLSVKELEGAVGGEVGMWEEGKKDEWSEVEGRDEDISVEMKDGGEGREIKKRGKGVDDRGRGDGSRGRVVRDAWGRRWERGGATAKFGRVTEEGMWGNSSPPPKRAASFPMDHFLSSHMMSRKLSLIVEEETH